MTATLALTLADLQATDLPARFVTRVEAAPDSDCWLWRGTLTRDGYGTVTLERRTQCAHRVTYEALTGPIPAGMWIDHLCRVRNCVNPAHLEAVTPRENTVRGTAGDIQRARTHCPQGHEYTDENTSWRGNKRACRACRKGKGRNKSWEA